MARLGIRFKILVLILIKYVYRLDIPFPLPGGRGHVPHCIDVLCVYKV